MTASKSAAGIIMTLESLRYARGKFDVLDQLLLPHESKYVAVANTHDGWNVIRKMQVLSINNID